MVKRAAKTENKFECVDKIFPAVSPFPLKAAFGMGAAVAVLDKSMDPGRYEDQVHWTTFQKRCGPASPTLGRPGVEDSEMPLEPPPRTGPG